MKKIILILICLFVSFDVNSLELNLSCNYKDYWERGSGQKDRMYDRDDHKDPTEMDGFFIINGKNLRSNLFNLNTQLDPIEILDEKQSDIFIRVRKFQDNDKYFEIIIDRYTGNMRVSYFDDKYDRNSYFEHLNYNCSKGSRKF